MKTNFTFCVGGRIQQLPDRFKQIVKRFVVSGHAALEFIQFSREFLVGRHLLAHRDECSHDPNTGFDGDLAVQNIPQH